MGALGSPGPARVGPRARDRRAPGLLAVLGPVLGALAAACGSAQPLVPAVSTPGAGMVGVSAQLQPLCEALGRAVEAREDEEARRMLARLEASAPTGRAAELARGYGRILAGRAELERLDLSLALEPLADGDPAGGRLVLVAVQPGPGALRLRLGPATLISALELVSADGREGAWRGTTSLDPLGDATLEPELPLVVPLALVELSAPGGALAARSRFELVVRSGELARAGEDALPAAEPRVRPLVLVRTDPRLSERPVEPAELARAVEIGIQDSASVLELAVRVAPERAAEALDALAGLAGEASGPELERLVPALRWLAPNAGLGGDSWAWRAWLVARAEAGPRAPRGEGRRSDAERTPEERDEKRLQLPRTLRPDGLAARDPEGGGSPR